jgi:hypothetical protein
MGKHLLFCSDLARRDLSSIPPAPPVPFSCITSRPTPPKSKRFGKRTSEPNNPPCEAVLGSN